MEVLIDKKWNKNELCKKVKISSSTMVKMTNEEMVAMSILKMIYAVLECNIRDVVEFKKLGQMKKLHNEKASLKMRQQI
jgi:Predicted transcriptional regulator